MHHSIVHSFIQIKELTTNKSTDKTPYHPEIYV